MGGGRERENLRGGGGMKYEGGKREGKVKKMENDVSDKIRK